MRSRLKTSALGALVIASMLLGAAYIDHNVALSTRLVEALRVGCKEGAIALACVVAGLFYWASGDRAAERMRLLLFALLLFWFGAVATSAVVDARMPLFFVGAMLPYLVAVLAFAATSLLLPSARALSFWITLSVIVVAVGVIIDAETLWKAGSVRRPGGVLGNRNYAGEYLAFGLAVAVATLERGRWRLLLPLLGFALALTRCRAAWLAGGLGLGILLAVVVADRRRPLYACVGLVLCGAVAAAVLPNRLRWKDEDPYSATLAHLVDLQSGSGALRVQQHRQTLELLRHHFWLGIGPGNWQTAMRMRAPHLAANRNAHSDYLRALSDGGLFALAGLVSLYACAAVLAWRRRRTFPEGFAFVMTAVIVSAADSPLYRIETTVLVFTMLAACAGIKLEVREREPRTAQARALTQTPSAAAWSARVRSQG